VVGDPQAAPAHDAGGVVRHPADTLTRLWPQPTALAGAAALSLVGCFFVVRAYDAGSLDGLGVAAAFTSAVAFAVYMVGSERAGHRHEPVTTLFWAFGFASLFWALAAPWWNFPFGEFDSLRNVALAAGVIVVGTLLPFICMVAAMGVAGVPEAGFVSLALVLNTVGMPIEILPLLLTVDWIIARGRSVTNVLSDMVLSILLDRKP